MYEEKYTLVMLNMNVCLAEHLISKIRSVIDRYVMGFNIWWFRSKHVNFLSPYLLQVLSILLYAFIYHVILPVLYLFHLYSLP